MSDTSGQGRVVSDEERARAVLEQLKSVHAFDLAYEMMVGLVSFGYQKMGLADETRPVRDLSDARVSIELLRALLEVVEREEGDERTSGIRDTLAQMQLAFAHAVQLANAEQAAAAEQAGERPPSRCAGRGLSPRRRRSRRPDEEARGEEEAGGDGEAGAEEEAGGQEEAGREEEAGRRDLISPRSRADEGGAGGAPLCRRQVPASAQKRDSSSTSPGSTTMNSSSCGPATSFSRKRSDPVRRSSGSS